MSDPTIHPLIAARALENLTRKIGAQQTEAITALEQAVALLRELAGQPDYGFANNSIQEYETALCQLRTLDPTQPPSAESMLAIAGRLQRSAAACWRACQARRREQSS